MPEDHGICQNKGADPTFSPVMDITATDAGVVYRDEDIFGEGGIEDGFGLLFEGDFVGCREDE
jgi:hypothetical protein